MSQARLPTMCAPRISLYFLSRMILTRPSVSPAVLARPLALLLQLLPDRLKLEIDHAGRHRELVALGEVVEQRPLEPHARDLTVFALHALADRRLERREVVEALALGEIVVDRDRLGLLDVLDRDGEAGLLGDGAPLLGPGKAKR